LEDVEDLPTAFNLFADLPCCAHDTF
jgi:hypothetical protein